LRTSTLIGGDENGISEGREDDPQATMHKRIPPQTEGYEIDGPFFFGVADPLKDTLSELGRPPKVFILRMRRVPGVDATGVPALEEFHAKCRHQGTLLILAGVAPRPLETMRKAGLIQTLGEENVHGDMTGALRRAWGLIEGPREPRAKWSQP